MSNKKHEIIDKLSQCFRTSSNDIDEANEIDIDDFIDVEINCVRIAFVRMIAVNEKILLSKYSDQWKKTAV